MNIQTLTTDELIQIKRKRSIRQILARKSHFWFFSIYLGHYITYPFASFHHEMFSVTEDEESKIAALIAFRGSGKSTLMSLSYPIWAVIGKLHKKFVLIINQTQAQARLSLTNIKHELEYNELLKADIGPFEEVSDEWGATSIVLSNFGARIAIASTEQSIRGVRHGQYRPDLVICDDVEDLELVKTKENRDKLWGWLMGEVIPIGDEGTKYIFVGNMLHEDSLMMRLKQSILTGPMDGEYKEFPLIDDDHRCLWPAKFPSGKEIEILKRKVANESAWCREYLLKIISDDDRIIRRNDIHYYNELPDTQKFPPRLIAVGTDLAISLGKNADFTAILFAYVTGYGKDLKVYILPQMVNKRLSFTETIAELKYLENLLFIRFKRHAKIYVEKISYQESLSQQLIVEGLFGEAVAIGNMDKRARLSLASPYISSARILFPRHGAAELINQLVNFGIEKHDDLADALTIMVLKIIEGDRPYSRDFPNDSEDKPIYRDYGDGLIDISKPFTAGIMDKQF